MLDLFQYNWQVREDWFRWCEKISIEELRKERTGGMGSIIKNLYHVCDCEQLWVAHLQERPSIESSIYSISTLQEVIDFSNKTRAVTEDFLRFWTLEDEDKILEIQSKTGKVHTFTYGKVLRHIITHEIHHIGQLSVWARELNVKPVSSDLIMRDY
ncbi:DinB family protein [Evansella sp. AB-rgal1]|uniref:DinB family protein n=1 Tax=Evansella sp. AB-rgal1 TaxID=3242696 RepID=UPI00359E8A3B